MAQIEKKIWPKYFELVLCGKKTHELRVADFSIEEGDTILLREWDPTMKSYTGRQLEKTVTHVSHFTQQQLDDFYGTEALCTHGLYGISLK